MCDILTVDEIAAELRCSKGMVYKAIRGKVPGATALPVLKLGRRRLVRRESLVKWLAENDTTARADGK